MKRLQQVMRANISTTQKTSDLQGDPSPKAARLLKARDNIIKQAMKADPKFARSENNPRSPVSATQTFQASIISTI